MISRRLYALMILPLVLPLEIIKLDNPFLPINLGNARLMYSNHIFIHYFNYLEIGTQLNTIANNIKLVKFSYKNLTAETSNISSILKNISTSDLDFSLEQVTRKYENLCPSVKSHRTKRGLLNPIGSMYKAAFGLLDADDGERINIAIKTLNTNQQNLFNSLDRQMSLSNKLIERLNTSLTIISDNQKSITNHIIKLEARYDTFIISSLKILTLQNIGRQITNNCIMLIDLINQLENAVMFAHLHVIHPSVIRTEEIQEMLHILLNHYDPDNLIFFDSILSYYKLLTTQVFFENERIIFTVNFPVITKDKLKLYQIIPIPQNNIIYYPTTFFILNAPKQKITVQEKCPEIESMMYCIQDNHQTDQCMLSTISTSAPTDCSRRSVALKTTLTQKIDNNLIVVPKSNDTLHIKCDNQERVQPIDQPVLIKLQSNCIVEVNKLKFDASNQKFSTSPLILPKIKIPEDASLPKYHPIEINNPELEKIQDLKHLINHPDPLIPVDITTHSYTSLILLLVIAIAAILIYLWYRYFGCACLKRPVKATILTTPVPQLRKPKIIQEVEMQPMQPVQSTPPTQHMITTQATLSGLRSHTNYQSASANQ